jgi:hypothetical protein
MDTQDPYTPTKQEPHTSEEILLAVPYAEGDSPLGELEASLNRPRRADGGHGVGFNPLAVVQATQFSPRPRVRTVRPGGDYSATWDLFSPSSVHFVAASNPEWSLLRIGTPQLTIAVAIGGERSINLVFHRFTTFNWFTVPYAEERIPNGVMTTVRLLNSVGGELRRDRFRWEIECLPCYDHQTVRPFAFPEFPAFYLDIEQVEITYEKFYCRHCRTYPCQPRDVP